MSDSGIQSPLGVNVVSSLLQNQGFYINPNAAALMGSSTNNANYTPGSIVNNTCLKWVTYAINAAYQNLGTNVSTTTYDNLISIGAQAIPALGNSKAPTYIIDDPSGVWSGQATSGYAVQGPTDQGQSATWVPYLSENVNVGVTQWGYIRLLALQAWNEFNWNGKTTTATVTAGSFVVGTVYTILTIGSTDFTSIGATSNTPGTTFTATGVGSGSGTASYTYVNNTSPPEYKEFTSSFLTADNFVNYSNNAITAITNSQTFQQGTYSNQNDLITGELSGVSLALQDFGQDLINLGKALNIAQINKFGLPSTLLQLIKQNNAQTANLNLALLASGLSNNEIDAIASGNITPTINQEQQLYSAFLIVQGADLSEILVPLQCLTKGLTSLADLLNVKKLFPISYTTLTVPIYNTTPGPTNSKTYYLLFIEEQLNPQLIAPAVVAQVAPVVPPAPPPVAVPVEPVIIPSTPVTQAASDTTDGGAGGGGCVVLESYLPSIDGQISNTKPIKQAYQLSQGHKLYLANENSLETTIGEVVNAINELQHCYRITTESGVSLVCSDTAPIPTKDHGILNTPDLLGKHVAVFDDGKTYWDKVVSVYDVGNKFVRAIDTGDHSFWAGEIEGKYILHHNVWIDGQWQTIAKN